MPEILSTTNVDHTIQEIVNIWRQFYPHEAKGFEQAVRMRREIFESQRRDASLRPRGLIPLRVRAAVNLWFPGFWDDPMNISRFFRVYTDMVLPKAAKIYSIA